jgi:septum site-determining protein MinC
MKRAHRPKPERPAAGPRRGAGKGSPDGLRELKELTKSELISLVVKLRAEQAAAAPAAAVAPGEVPPVEVPPVEVPPFEPATAPAEVPTPTPRKAALVIEASVRSGQTVEFPEGDVTVIGSVGSGAEIIAGGSIHVYGSLRGRAVAGTSGDQTARIFCQDFDAELLSIDGKYRVADNVDRELRGRPIQARLDGLRMMLVPLEGDAAAAPAPAVRPPPYAERLRRATDRMRQFMSIGAPRSGPLSDAPSA